MLLFGAEWGQFLPSSVESHAMLGYLLLAFILVPLAEIWLLIRIGRAIDVGPTLGLIVLTGVIGAALARREGARTLYRIHGLTARGELPALAMVEGLLIFVAGVLLVTPGVITDCAGFLLLLPPMRRWAARRLGEYFRARIVVAGPGMHVDIGETYGAGREEIIDVEYRDVTDEQGQRLPDEKDRV